MLKSDLLDKLACRWQRSLEESDEILKLILDQLKVGLIEYDRIELRNFGVFDKRPLRAGTGRNPRTGESVLLPDRLRIHFRYSKKARQKIKCQSCRS